MASLLIPVVTGTLEAGFNRFLQLAPERLKKVQPLAGKVLQLTVTSLGSCYLLFSKDRLDVMQNYEGQPDSHLTLSLDALGLLKDKGLLMQYIREGRIDLEGDPQLWQDFSTLLKDPLLDMEDILAGYTGDVMAHLLCRHGRELSVGMHNRLTAASRHLGDYVLEEARLAVGPLELADFCDQVTELDKQLLRLQGRLAALTDKVDH
ncbi:ubiquinone biosynthesis accessory factor UbiJ [Zobellella maritima]|uniref:ubiquinone biosynthesis accessory factor UbiJ n=1 Tax=Zobellella maritima TaxID=2059725 RepID=UPI000E307282|nr:SCP2 sterol-binding domain-containing protein [Zobellella maritima]